MTRSLPPSVSMTKTSSSPSSRVSAILPPRRWYSYSVSSVRLITPNFVTIVRYSSLLNSSTPITAVTFSPGESSSILTRFEPLAVLDASGI